VEKGDEWIKITAGWGSNVKASWRNDLYTAEVIFMDQLLAVASFEVGEYMEEGSNPVWLPEKGQQIMLEPEPEDDHTFRRSTHPARRAHWSAGNQNKGQRTRSVYSVSPDQKKKRDSPKKTESMSTLYLLAIRVPVKPQ
jgi:hypothetical protein